MPEPYRLTLVTPPATLPLSLNEAKAHLRLEDDQTADDAAIMALVRAAVEQCEQFTGRALMTQVWSLFRDAWPGRLVEPLWEGVRIGADLATPARAVELPKPPLQSVVHVKTYDESDVGTVWSSGSYFVDTASEPGRLVARTGQVFPTTIRASNGIEIQFSAGYGSNPADVPQDLTSGLLRLVAHLYERRGDDPADAMGPSGAASLWRPYRVVRV